MTLPQHANRFLKAELEAVIAENGGRWPSDTHLRDIGRQDLRYAITQMGGSQAAAAMLGLAGSGRSRWTPESASIAILAAVDLNGAMVSKGWLEDRNQAGLATWLARRVGRWPLVAQWVAEGADPGSPRISAAPRRGGRRLDRGPGE